MGNTNTHTDTPTRSLRERSLLQSLHVVRSHVCHVMHALYTLYHSGAYGIDLGTDIAALLRAVVGLVESHPASAGRVMVRLGMTNPPYMLRHCGSVGEVLRHPQVYEFIHVPIQSGSNDTLRHMVGGCHRWADGWVDASVGWMGGCVCVCVCVCIRCVSTLSRTFMLWWMDSNREVGWGGCVRETDVQGHTRTQVHLSLSLCVCVCLVCRV